MWKLANVVMQNNQSRECMVRRYDVAPTLCGTRDATDSRMICKMQICCFDAIKGSAKRGAVYHRKHGELRSLRSVVVMELTRKNNSQAIGALGELLMSTAERPIYGPSLQ